MRSGARGGPFLPQPAAYSAAAATSTRQTGGRGRDAGNAERVTGGTLEDVPAQVLVLHDVGQHPADVDGIDRDFSVRHLGGVERERVQEPFHDRVQPPRADVSAL